MYRNKITGAKLRKLRLAAGLSLDAMAARTGYTKGYISALELDHFAITDKARQKITRALSTQSASRNEKNSPWDAALPDFKSAAELPASADRPTLAVGSTVHGSATQLSMASIQLFHQAAEQNSVPVENRTIGILTHRPYGFISQILHLHSPWMNALDALLRSGYEVMHLLDLRYTKPYENLQLLRYLIRSFRNQPSLCTDYKIYNFRGSSVSLSHDMFLVPGFGAILGFPTDSYEMVDSGIYLNDAPQLHILENYFSTLASHAVPMFTFFSVATAALGTALHAMDSIPYPRYLISHGLPSALIPPQQFASRNRRIYGNDPAAAMRGELQGIRHDTQLTLARRYAYRFTLSKAWVLDFLQGTAPFPFDSSDAPFTKPEATAAVKAIIQLLRTLPKLELCLLDQIPDDLKEFTWYGVDNRVMLMPLAGRDAAGAVLPKIHIDIQERLFVNAFASMAENIWKSQPERNRDKTYVQHWLQEAVANAFE